MAKTKQAKKTNPPAKPASKTTSKATSKAKGPAKKPVKKERGAVLSVLLALIVLHGAFAIYLAFSTLKQEYAGSTSWVLPVLALVSLANIVAAVGMWYWKKWAIYLYLAASVVAGAVHLILTGSGLVLIYDLLPVAILGYVINLQSKRNLFE